MLTLKNISRNFGNEKNKITVLDGINLSINKGEMLSIMGPSGSGKSTLLHIIGCLDSPSSGSYYINDVNVSTLSDKDKANIRNKQFGFILQQFALIEEETVLENVTIPLLFSNKNLFHVDIEAENMLKLLHMENLSEKKVKSLSGGEKQRVAIARALINHPEIILADEPTGSLDSKNTQLIMDLLIKLNKNGKTIVIITHDSYVAESCTIRYHMVNGKLCLRG